LFETFWALWVKARYQVAKRKGVDRDALFAARGEVDPSHLPKRDRGRPRPEDTTVICDVKGCRSEKLLPPVDPSVPVSRYLREGTLCAREGCRCVKHALPVKKAKVKKRAPAKRKEVKYPDVETLAKMGRE